MKVITDEAMDVLGRAVVAIDDELADDVAEAVGPGEDRR
jgi:hypothetical protein